MKRLVPILLSFLFLFAPSVISAATMKVTIYAEANGKASNWTLYSAQASFSNDRNGIVVFSGDCGPDYRRSWNDCASSFKVWLPSGRCIVFYEHANYSGKTYAVHGYKSGRLYNFPYWINDESSSMRFGYVRGGVCTYPWR